MKELLKIAKEKYPVGCKFIPLNLEFMNKGTEFQIISSWNDTKNSTEQEIWVNTGDYNSQIYNFGIWAQIISKPEVKATDISENISSVIDSYADFVPETTQRVKTFGQIKEDNFFKTATESLCKMLQAKNKAYGESALKPLDIFAKHHNYGSRLDEKLARIKNSSELRKNDVADIIGGLFLICKDKGWDDFTDLID